MQSVPAHFSIECLPYCIWFGFPPQKIPLFFSEHDIFRDQDSEIKIMNEPVGFAIGLNYDRVAQITIASCPRLNHNLITSG
jgi:hypothetical protein